MPLDRPVLRSTPVAVTRRPAQAAIQRSPAAGRPAAVALRERLGNQAAGHVARAIAHPSKSARLPPNVSRPTDPAELEAEAVARKVMRMGQPAQPQAVPGKGAPRGRIQRSVTTAPAPAAHAASPRAGAGGGAPLPAAVRSTMEPRFGASFAGVRVHTGEAAARESAQLGAAAFTVGEHVFFGHNRYQPQTAAGQELIAHELTHTIQQGATPQDVVQRSPAVPVTETVTHGIQRSFLGIPSPREYFGRKAATIPGFTLLTVAIGFNPVSGARVERNAGNLLRGAIQLVPGAKLITDALDAHGLFDRVSVWAAERFREVEKLGSGIWQAIEDFLARFSITDLADPGGLWERAKAIVTRPIDAIIAFAVALKDGIVALVKDAVLRPIAAFAATTRGYPLLRTVLGKDPITGETVPQDAEALLGGFMTFIGQEELWATMQKAKAIPRAFAWFKGAMAAVRTFVAQIPALFVQAFRALEIADLILIPRAFQKLAGVFGGFVARFVSWGADAVWKLLEIVFDVVSPGALVYVKKTGAALWGILKNPLPFVGNLVRAAKLGFTNFADNFLAHLKAGLIDWLTGSLPGVYIPKAFTLAEIAKFTFSVLGISWANIRQKLVKATSETVVKAMETGFDIVVTLVREGPAAAWDKIKEQLSNLKDMVIGGITDFVVDTVVKKAVPKLISMFIPGAGFISAILSIYDTIMVFVEKLARIIAVVRSFVDSLLAIAAGQIGAAATRVESALAGLLSLAISFLAGFVGLGKVSDKLMGVIDKVRGQVDKALDWLVGWIVKAGKAFLAKGKAAAGKVLGWAFATRTFKDDEGKQHSLKVGDAGALTIESDPVPAQQFIAAYAKRKGEALTAEEKRLIKDIQALVVEANDVVRNARAKGPEPSPAEQTVLLKKNTEISELLRQLLGRRPMTGLEKYDLEGQVGTYATVPKPTKDQLTADHQPQAAVILGAADVFKKRAVTAAKENKGEPEKDLAARATDRAAKGYAINLHFRRHVAGATYGSKGEKQESFFQRMMKATKGKETSEVKATVSTELKRLVGVDADRMREVTTFKLSHEAWSHLIQEAGGEPEAEKLKEKISDRIKAGEKQIEAQPLDF